MARTHVIVAVAGIGVAALLVLPVLVFGGPDCRMVCADEAQQHSGEPRECPQCPSVTAMQWFHDTVDANPWLTVVFASVCNLLRLTGGMYATMAVDYVVMPAYVSIRSHHRWRLLTDSAYELVGVLLVSLLQCVTLPMVFAAYQGAVKYFAAGPVSPPRSGDVDKGDSPAVGRCECVVQSTGKPCDRRSTGRRDGRCVCGMHERAKRVHFTEKK